jgi:putative N6-adenine-specific DNA methylase
MQLTATTLFGLEEVLANELKQLGATNIKPTKRAVEFEGDQKLLYRANFELRTAIRVLLPIKKFKARSEDQLYRNIRKINWAQYLHVDGTLAIDATTHSNFFKHSKYAALKSKDAIVDQFRKSFGRRPNINLDSPDLRINLHINQDLCTVSLDSSGDSLHKRGYRSEAVDAPLSEVLAAGIIQLTGWQCDCDFIDPMCGSGTNIIEAALYAYNIPSQLQRREFGFMKWKDYDKNLWQTVVEEGKARIRDDFPHKILGFDKDFKAVRVSQWNIIAAKIEGKVEAERKPFERLTPPGVKGILVINPPYELRLVTGDINGLYKMIGDQLKQQFGGYEAWIISPNMEAFKHVGLRPSRKIVLFNGPLECKLQKYELYAGSKKAKFNVT